MRKGRGYRGPQAQEDNIGKRCELCGRLVDKLTKHHLIPKARHNKRVKAKYGEECKMRLAMTCKPCHRQLHYLFEHKELEGDLNTLDSLKAHPAVAKYIEWIKDKPSDFIPRKGKRK